MASHYSLSLLFPYYAQVMRITPQLHEKIADILEVFAMLKA